MQRSTKPLAPFGAELNELRSNQKKLNSCPYLFVGRDACAEAQKFWDNGFIALALPIGKQVDEYDWPIKDLRIILYDTGSMTKLGLKRIAYDLLKIGADVVVIFNPEDQSVEVQNLKRI